MCMGEEGDLRMDQAATTTSSWVMGVAVTAVYQPNSPNSILPHSFNFTNTANLLQSPLPFHSLRLLNVPTLSTLQTQHENVRKEEPEGFTAEAPQRHLGGSTSKSLQTEPQESDEIVFIFDQYRQKQPNLLPFIYLAFI